MKGSRRDHQDPINNPYGAGIEIGFHRPRILRDAPRWFVLLMFAFAFGTLAACLLLSRW
jgi:hypothetical protein